MLDASLTLSVPLLLNHLECFLFLLTYFILFILFWSLATPSLLQGSCEISSPRNLSVISSSELPGYTSCSSTACPVIITIVNCLHKENGVLRNSEKDLAWGIRGSVRRPTVHLLNFLDWVSHLSSWNLISFVMNRRW